MWVQHWGLLPSTASQESFAASQFTELVGCAYPHASSDLLALIADWNSWTFLVDTQLDLYDLGRDPDLLRSFAATTALIMADRRCQVDPNWPPLLLAFAEIIDRLREYATLTWMRRFRHHVGATFSQCIAEAQYRQSGTLVSEKLYLSMRPHTSGVYCFLDLIELAESAPLPDHVRGHPYLVSLTALTTQIIFLANDMASAEKERLQGDGNNLVLIVEREQQLTSAQAMAYVQARHDRLVPIFLSAREHLPSVDYVTNLAVTRYVRGLEYWIRANADWSILSGRYNRSALDLRANEVLV